MKAIAIFLVILFIEMVSIMTPVIARASDAPSWVSQAPLMIRNGIYTSYEPLDCAGNLVVKGISRACLFGGEGLKIGYFDNGGPYEGAVQFPYSDEIYSLEGICDGALCRYDAKRDMVVTQYHHTPFGLGTAVYLHASKRIEKIYSSGSAIRYVFDTTHPDYEVKDDTGTYVWTSFFNLSDNGKWLIAELRGIGLVLIDTDTFASHQIMRTEYLYGRSVDLIEQLAVSDDGKTVVLTGDNAGFTVINVTDACYQFNIASCPTRNIDVNSLFSDFYFAEYPHFSDDGRQLDVVVHNGSGEVRRVSFLEYGAVPAHPLQLLALGDSFTSGEGETDMSYYEPGTNDLFDNCHVSTRAYPFLIAARIGISTIDAKSVACAGARVGDIIGTSDTYWGQGNRLGDTGLKFSVASKTAAQTKAIDTFQPGRALQSAFLTRYNPEIITIGVGGNDAGLMGKLSVCAMPDTCEWARGDGLKATANEIKRLFDTLGALFARISHDYPGAKVYIVGYPNIIDPDGVCDLTTGALLDYSERVFIEKALQYLDQIIHAATQKASFTYLDIEQSMKGKTLCSGVISEAMNGIRLGNDIAAISKLPMLKVIGAGTFHPTPVGHALVADAILAEHPGLSQDVTCSTDPMACIIPAISTDPPPFWGISNGTNRQTFLKEFATSLAEHSKQLTITVPDGTFEPTSTVNVEIHSSPRLLGTFTVDANGGVNTTVDIPSDIESGFHTIHMFGTNNAGESIDAYEFITIGEDSEALGIGTGEGNVPSLLAPSSAVLGAQDIASNTAKIESVSLKSGHYVDQTMKNNTLLVFIISGGSIAALSVVLFILLHRRWAKPAS
jgi:hypothetical protein